MKESLIKISVVIPAHNEEAVVEKMISILLKNFDRYIMEIIIVNDCSTDQTRQILSKIARVKRKLKVIHRRSGNGVGNAIRAGLRSVSKRAEYVLLLDCDFIENVKDIKRMIKHARSADGVLGSRYMKSGVLVNYPPMKMMANRMFHFLLLLLLQIRHKDISNNFKLYRYDLMRTIFPYLKSTGFSINAETGIYPVILGYNLKEVPVSWIGRTAEMGKSSFNVVRAGPGYARVLFETLLFKYLLRSKVRGGIYVKSYQKS